MSKMRLTIIHTKNLLKQMVLSHRGRNRTLWMKATKPSSRMMFSDSLGAGPADARLPFVTFPNIEVT